MQEIDVFDMEDDLSIWHDGCRDIYLPLDRNPLDFCVRDRAEMRASERAVSEVPRTKTTAHHTARNQLNFLRPTSPAATAGSTCRLRAYRCWRPPLSAPTSSLKHRLRAGVRKLTSSSPESFVSNIKRFASSHFAIYVCGVR